jgi:hypothetical protein
MNNEKDYSDGISDERSRVDMICEMWTSPAYINTRYGPIDDAGLKVLLRVVALIKEDVDNGTLPGRS